MQTNCILIYSLNLTWPGRTNSCSIVKILIFFIRDHQKNSYERCDYKSVDDNLNSWEFPKKARKNEFRLCRFNTVPFLALSPVILISKLHTTNHTLESPTANSSSTVTTVSSACYTAMESNWALIYYNVMMISFFFVPLFLLMLLYIIIARRLVRDTNTAELHRKVELPNMRARRQVKYFSNINAWIYVLANIWIHVCKLISCESNSFCWIYLY